MTDTSSSQRHVPSIAEACRFLVPAIALTFVLGGLTGSIATAWLSASDVPLQIVDDTSSGGDVSVVHIDGIRNGALVGTVSGEVRLVGGENFVDVAADGTFTIKDTKILTNVIQIQVPEGMHFVASKRGKKYYPVNSASAQNLSLENRIYFPDEQSAQKAGYSR